MCFDFGILFMKVLENEGFCHVAEPRTREPQQIRQPFSPLGHQTALTSYIKHTQIISYLWTYGIYGLDLHCTWHCIGYHFPSELQICIFTHVITFIKMPWKVHCICPYLSILTSLLSTSVTPSYSVICPEPCVFAQAARILDICSM